MAAIFRIVLFGILGLSLLGSTAPCSDGHQDFVEFAILAQRHNVPIWSNDGTKIVFSRFPSGTFVVEADGAHMWPLPPDSPLEPRIGNFAVAFSPDGSRVAYAMVNRRKNTSSIVTSNLDGSNLRKLTDENVANMYPTWSPDGSQIAFLSGKPLTGRFELFVMNADGSDRKELETSVGLWPIPPVWSPNGSRIAFTTRDWLPEGGKIYESHTIQPDGNGLISLGESASGATWSPDGTRIAFIAKEGDTYTLSIMNPLGTDRVALASFTRNDQAFFDNISWSPDGSQILYGSSDLYSGRGRPVRIIGISGTDPKVFEWPGVGYEIVSAAWSPDGSRIAFHLISEDSHVVLYTTARDGSDEHILVRGNDRSRIFPRPNIHTLPPEIRLIAENADWQPVTPDLAACGEGKLVSDPDRNPGLVGDCETLLGIRNSLAGDAVLHLNWTADVPMSRWSGVEIEGLPARVVRLNLSDFRPAQLNGVIPSGLEKLTQLQSLDLGMNSLSGKIPPELGSLSQLERLELSFNALEGTIPTELGNLSSLKDMYITDNMLTGPVPKELARIQELTILNVSGNKLTGCIPSELRGRVPFLRSGGLEYC